MFQATLAKRDSSDAQQARKMREIEARAKEKFQKTADDPERVARLLHMRTREGQKEHKKYLRTRAARAVMQADKTNTDGAGARSLHDQKLRAKKMLYGETGEEVEYHPGDQVRSKCCVALSL